MFQNKTLLSSITFASILSLYDMSAHACLTAGPGKYCYFLKEYPCEAGCYCNTTSDNYSKIFDVAAACRNGGEGDKLRAAGLKWCPHPYTSDKGARTEDDCYTKTSDGKIAYYTTYSCPAGQYFPAGSITCKTCKTGYRCPGVKDYYSASKDRGIEICPSGTSANSGHTACVSNTPKSQPVQQAQPAPNKPVQVTCNAGKYLPANATSCSNCQDRYYCPGGTFTKASFAQGLKQCAVGQKPDSSRRYCVNEIVATCNAGQYLPANATSCSDCQDRYYCPGGSFAKLSFDQGLFRCATGYIPNANKSSCIDASDQSFYCEPGFFLPGKATECKRCSTTKNYCPGGDFLYAEFDQGIYNCPYISVANADRSSCVMTLTQDYMKYGPNGSNSDISEQCWAKKTTDEYINCIFSEKTQKIEPSLPSKKIMAAPVLKPQNLRSLPGDLMIEKPVNLRKEVNIIEKGAFDKVSIEAVKKI